MRTSWTWEPYKKFWSLPLLFKPHVSINLKSWGFELAFGVREALGIREGLALGFTAQLFCLRFGARLIYWTKP